MSQDPVSQRQETESSQPATPAADLDIAELFQKLAQTLFRYWKLLVLGPLAAGLVSVGVTVFLPPQQAQSGTASALASLGSLAGLAGNIGGAGASVERYVALMQSTTVADKLVDHFNLMEVYDAKFRVDARKKLASNVRISIGRRDGLITVETDDKSPQRAADIANRFVDELRQVTSKLALTEAQQRRVFFERHLQLSRDRLTKAQTELQASGFSAGALKAEPKAAADAYARLKAEATAAELRLMLLRNSLADSTPEVKQQQSALMALQAQLAVAEKGAGSLGGPDYIGKYREFKYQETLFDVYARQFELARADESREGALIQIVDPAQAPERKSSPKRAVIAVSTTLLAALILAVVLVIRRYIQPPPTPSGALHARP
jgi:capsular polysaccharide biosynthesis protein